MTDQNKVVFTPDYFIEKFSAMSDKGWDDPLVALGAKNPYALKGEALAFSELFGWAGLWMMEINEGSDPAYDQPTGRERIIAALHTIKAKMQ